MSSILPPEDVDLRSVFNHAVSSTWVITSAHRGRPIGFTTVSVMSASTRPPVVTFNLGRTARSRGIITASGRVALHLLRDDQAHVARRFEGDRAQRLVPDGQWFWHADGLPTLHRYVDRLRATVTEVRETGDSVLLTATVTAQESGDGDVLAYHHGRYRSLDEHIDSALQEAFAKTA